MPHPIADLRTGACAWYWLKELQESIERCTGCSDVDEILLKAALNTIQSIIQSIKSFIPFSLLNDKISDLPKMKAFTGNKITLTQKLFFESVENITGKGENAGYQHFFRLSKCFHKASSLGMSTLYQTTKYWNCPN